MFRELVGLASLVSENSACFGGGCIRLNPAWSVKKSRLETEIVEEEKHELPGKRWAASKICWSSFWNFMFESAKNRSELLFQEFCSLPLMMSPRSLTFANKVKWQLQEYRVAVTDSWAVSILTFHNGILLNTFERWNINLAVRQLFTGLFFSSLYVSLRK